MKLCALLRLLCCAIAVGFLGDLLRRCVIVEAWSVGPVVAVLLVLALIAVRRAGAMLSNCAYNLAQRQHLTDDERRSLDESRQAWDAAIAAAPAPEAR